jgi:hypothetical protein
MKLTKTAFIFLLMTFVVFTANAQNFGYFIGKVVTEWQEDGRGMKLVEPFAYISPTNERWDAPAGSIIDGASIPQLGWSFIGGPFEGKYREASVIHDVACKERNRPWHAVHETFYWAMLASGVSSKKAKIMYAAVYQFGPRWTTVVEKVSLRTDIENTTSLVKSTFVKGTTFHVDVEEDLYSGPHPDKEPEVKVTVAVAAFPPPPNLHEKDFDKLKQAIEANDLSLEQIRDFKIK